MTNQKKREAMARLDGYEFRGACWFRGEIMISRGIGLLPDYFHPIEGHGHIHRVIVGLSPEELREYHCQLEETFCLLKPEWFHLMTCEQKVDAILKALGLWTKEME